MMADVHTAWNFPIVQLPRIAVDTHHMPTTAKPNPPIPIPHVSVFLTLAQKRCSVVPSIFKSPRAIAPRFSWCGEKLRDDRSFKPAPFAVEVNHDTPLLHLTLCICQGESVVEKPQLACLMFGTYILNSPIHTSLCLSRTPIPRRKYQRESRPFAPPLPVLDHSTTSSIVATFMGPFFFV